MKTIAAFALGFGAGMVCLAVANHFFETSGRAKHSNLKGGAAWPQIL